MTRTVPGNEVVENESGTIAPTNNSRCQKVLVFNVEQEQTIQSHFVTIKQ